MIIRTTRQPLTLPLRFLGGVLLALAFTLAVFWALMQPPLDEFRAMTWFLGITAAISVGVGFVAYRLGWVSTSPRVSWTLVSSYILASTLTFLNVWWTARLMFINQHDLTLATILLVFAAGIAVTLGYFLSASVTDRISALARGAEEIAAGRFNTRVQIEGRDEVTALANSFNSMASQLEAAEQKKSELDRLRRDSDCLDRPRSAHAPHLRAGDRRGAGRRRRRRSRLRLPAISAPPSATSPPCPPSSTTSSIWRSSTPAASSWIGGRSPISDLISDTLESFMAQALDKNVVLSGMAAPGVDPVYADARQIGRVLSNLVGNALRHTPAGGSVTVHAYVAASGVLVEVSDSGEGIRPDDLPHVFEQFFRGEKSRSRTTGGAGLGLAIAKAIVEAHGGQIRVESKPGQGARFTFILPQAPQAFARHPLLRGR